jgi:hypothetical protein
MPNATTVHEKHCTKCGVLQPITLFYTTGKRVDGSPKWNSWCKACIAIKQSSYHRETWGTDKLKYTAFKRTKTVRSYLQYLRGKAVQRKRNGEVISLDALEVIWNTQQGRCALTGWPMTMELGNGVIPTNCSIDRIDATKGYIVGNIQLVCRAVNVAKHDLSMQDFIVLCRAVVEQSHGV